MPACSLPPKHALAFVLAAPIVALTLAGCGIGPSPEGIVERIVEEAAAQSGEDLDFDVDTSGEGASLPTGWPDLPVPEGRIVSAMKISDSFNISVEIADEDAARTTISELQAAGFELTGETDFGELKGAVLSSPEWNAVLGWTISEDGIVMSYTLSKVTS